MNKRSRVCDLDQPFLLPPSLEEWLPENHLARFIAEVMNELDLSALYRQYERRDGRGLSAYHPLLLTRLLLYGYCTVLTSSRAIERAAWEQIPFRYLAADQHPDHDTLAHFRRQHLEALAGLFVQALRLCQKAGLVKLDTIALDGTKMLANASPSRSVPPAKLSEREQYWQAAVERLLAEAEAADAQEDRQWGKGRRGDELLAELAEAQSRLERLRRARAELEEEARQQLEAARSISALVNCFSSPSWPNISSGVRHSFTRRPISSSSIFIRSPVLSARDRLHKNFYTPARSRRGSTTSSIPTRASCATTPASASCTPITPNSLSTPPSR